MSHHHSCPLFLPSANTTKAKFRLTSRGKFLARAIEASISIKRSAGGSSISPVLQYVVHDPAAFQLIDLRFSEPHRDGMRPRRMSGLMNLEASLDVRIRELERLFQAGKASPYDVDLEGNTLLHLAAKKWRCYFLEVGFLYAIFESMVRYLTKLGELAIPLNWTNQCNLTFMNELLLQIYAQLPPGTFATLATPLLDIGAEFAKFEANRTIVPRERTCRMIGHAPSADVIDALDGSEVSLAVLHRSERELIEALQMWPQSIDMSNGLAQTPLHLAVEWPEGVRLLLQHGACVDSRHQTGDTPLYYALTLGVPQTVSLLMKADCSLVPRLNVLDLAIINLHQQIGGVSEDVRMEVLDTTIELLAERRRGLQSRLTGLPLSISINTTVLRDDRVLDEYAECTEQALRKYNDYIPLRASSLLKAYQTYLGNCRTVYHIFYLTVESAEKLWKNGFRDIDVPDEDGLTPLASHKDNASLELYSWLIQKGAKLHRPQSIRFDDDPNPAIDPTGLLQITRALHYVAVRIAIDTSSMALIEFHKHEKKVLQNWTGRLSKDARLLLANIFSDGSSDDCICACSSRGCLASTLMLKAFKNEAPWFPNEQDARHWVALSLEYLVNTMGPPSSCWDWLAREIIRVRTFQELELRHTCCFFGEFPLRIFKFPEEERAEIQDEDKEKIKLLESLLLEFEEHRGAQDLISFFEGYWATRMNEVLEELKSGVDEEGLRGIGVVLEESVGNNWQPQNGIK